MSDTTPRLRLDFYSSRVVRTQFQQGQACSVCEVAPAEVVAAMAGMGGSATLLPPSAVFAGSQGGQPLLGILRPAGGAVLRLTGLERTFKVNLPALVFAGVGTSYHVYALRTGQWPTGATPLYLAPFPNVYLDGRICPGSVEFPVCGPESIHGALALFLASEFNHDLDGRRSERYAKDVAQWWFELHGSMWPYPVEDLQPMNRTLGELVQHWGDDHV